MQIKKDDIPKIKQLIESIEEDPNAEPFREPVQWQGIYYINVLICLIQRWDYQTIHKLLRSQWISQQLK